MTYAVTLHVDVDVEFRILPDENIGTRKVVTETVTLPKIYFGRFYCYNLIYVC